jgi:hypothetical protein
MHSSIVPPSPRTRAERGADALLIDDGHFRSSAGALKSTWVSDMIKLTKEREIAPYAWVRPDDDNQR